MQKSWSVWVIRTLKSLIVAKPLIIKLCQWLAQNLREINCESFPYNLFYNLEIWSCHPLSILISKFQTNYEHHYNISNHHHYRNIVIIIQYCHGHNFHQMIYSFCIRRLIDLNWHSIQFDVIWKWGWMKDHNQFITQSPLITHHVEPQSMLTLPITFRSNHTTWCDPAKLNWISKVS